MEKESIIYKVRNRSNEYHRNLLLKNQLWFASPHDFNDPFDPAPVSSLYPLCFNPKKWSELAAIILDWYSTHKKNEEWSFNTQDELKYKSWFNNTDELVKKWELVYSHFVTKKKALDSKQLENLFIHFSNALTNELQLLEFFTTGKNFGVCSFTKNIENILIWSHYGDEHKGYAVGFKLSEIKKLEKLDTTGNVQYTDDRLMLHPFRKEPNKGITLSLLRKSINWNYEQEYRAIIQNVDELSKSDRTIHYNDSCIAEVVLPIYQNNKDHEYNFTNKDIIEECRKRKIKVKYLAKSLFEYKVGFIEKS